MTAAVRLPSRQRLLDAARELFAERGFDRVTTREVGDRAGVDPALIARHFGGKAGLYVAALREADQGPVPDLLQPGRLTALLSRVALGPGPVLQACVRRHDDPAVQEPAQAELQRRLVAPLAARLAEAGGDDSRLRAEVAVAAVAGVALARAAGSLDALAEAPADDVVALLTRLLDALR